MKRVQTSHDLGAPAEEAWTVLSDFQGWSDWNPVIPKMEADGRVGGAVRFEIRVGDRRPMKLASKFVTWDEARELAWGGGLPGLFTGRHYFRLEPLQDGTCRIIHGEDFSALIPWIMLTKRRLTEVEEAYTLLNQALAAELSRRG